MTAVYVLDFFELAYADSDDEGGEEEIGAKIIPVNFNKEPKAMLGHCKMILENEGGRIAINPIFDKLITL